MKTRNYWPLLFIGIFLFTFSMIVWTVSSAIKAPVHEDNSFLSTYHSIDGNYNDIVESNELFNSKYDIKIKINDTLFGLDIKDIFASQRVIDKKSLHKDIFKKGKNSLIVSLSNKNGTQINAVIKFKVTRATNNDFDIDISNENDKNKEFTFELNKVGNWNITGIIETEDKNKGYFYIKSNAITK